MSAQSDWMPRASAFDLPEGTERHGSTGQLWRVKNGQWVRVETTDGLMPCRFCWGRAEMDKRRSYRSMASGDIKSAVAIYCLKCPAEMSMCHEDHPNLSVEEMAEVLSNQWNRQDVKAANHHEGLVEALREIAAFDDTNANRHLEMTGSYAAFDEPASVAIARAILSRAI
jgi:RecJ-like exonuclease